MSQTSPYIGVGGQPRVTKREGSSNVIRFELGTKMRSQGKHDQVCTM